MKQDEAEIEIANNETAHRFQAIVDAHLAFVQYRYSHGGEIVLVHTEVPAAVAGRGIGSRLARAALEYARSRELKVIPACPFIAAYMKKHPEYQALATTDSPVP